MTGSEHQTGRDRWSDGDAYERYVGRWSRRVAAAFLDWLGPPPGLDWADIGCGTGALTARVLEAAAPKSIVAIDMADGFLAHARQSVSDARVRFERGDAQSLPLGDGCCDTLVSGLMLNFVPDAAKALREMRRAARPGGMVALYVWDYADGMQFMRYFWDAAAALDPKARDLDEGRRFPICNPVPLTRSFAEAGFRNVECRPIDVPTEFAGFDDFWTPFLGGQGPAPGYCVSLSPDRRDALRRRLVNVLPTDADGRIRLTARVWAVRGTAPG